MNNTVMPLRSDRMTDPVRGICNSVVNARLTTLSARISGRNDANQGPPAIQFGHERSTTVTLAGVLSTSIITGAHHFTINHDIDPFVAVPLLALSVVNHGH